MSGLQQWAKSAPADDFWIWMMVCAIASLVGFVLAFYYLHKKRVIQDIPTSKIRSAAQGYVEFEGHGYLMDGQPVLSPLTQKPCTWYEIKVEEQTRSGNNNNWKTIRKAVSDELFLIKDETGECVIDPEGAKVTVSDKQVWYGHSATPTKSPGRNKPSFLRSVFSSTGKYRYTEKLLHSGETLYAIGMLKTVGGAGAKMDINEDVRELIREWKADTESMLKRFDLNKDGEIDMDEWQKVRDEAYKHVVAKHHEQKNLPPVNIMSRTRDKRRPFILSALSQDELTRKFHLYTVLSISAFVCFGVFATLVISLRLAT